MFWLKNQFFSRYKGTAIWLWYDAICRFSNRIIKSVLASMTSLAFQVAAFAIVFFFAKALEQNKVFSLLGYPLNSRSAGLIICVGLFAFLFFIASALLGYFTAKNSIELRRNYAEWCFKRVLVFLSRLPHPVTNQANQMLAEGELKGGLRTESGYCGRFLCQLVELILPAGSLFAYSVFLFVLSPFLSMIMFPLVILSFILLQKIYTSSSQTSRDLKRHAEQASFERRLILQRIFRCAAPVEYSDKLINEIFRKGRTKDYSDAFYRRFIFAERTRLVVNIMMSAAVLGIIIVAATGVMSKDWSVIFAYLVALRAASSSLSHLGSGVTQLSRFFPHVETYLDFVRSVQPVRNDVPPRIHGDAVHLKVPSIMNSAEAVILKPDQPIFLLHPGSVDRALASRFQVKTIYQDEDRPIRYWFADKINFQGNTLRECLGLPGSLTDAEINKKLNDLCFNERINRILPVNLDGPIEEEEEKKIPSYGLSVIKLIAGAYSNCQVIIMSNREVDRVKNIFAKELMDIMANRILIRSCRELPSTSVENEESLVLIANDRELVGWCLLGWLDRNPEIIQKLSPEGSKNQSGMEELVLYDEDD